MHKISLIIKREYFSRVKKKSFLLMTFIVPLLFLGMWAGVIFLSVKDADTVTRVNVIDNTDEFINRLESSSTLQFTNATSSPEVEKEKVNQENNKNQYLLIIPKNIAESQQVELYSSSGIGLFTQEQISSQLNTILRGIQLNEAGIDTKILESIKPNIKISSKEITMEGEKDSNAGAAMGISMFSSIIIYITLFIYGAQVMRGVIEEKNNRIVEVIISSVRPFQLMLGKIIGIGLVGLTQFILWIVLSGALFSAATLLFDNSGSMASQMENIGGSTQQSTAMQSEMILDIQKAVSTINFPYIIGTFLFYFIGGYLLYSALFAAVGSAVDNETETQQFMIPITMPLLFTYMMSFSVLLKDPSGPLAFWLSMIPFTSPIAMLVRIPFGVPAWQLALSMFLLVAGFIFTTWVAARIYRVGILMYGKKASYKELLKWFKYKN
jgi:ABC-2 type transport system permease protein